MAVFFPHLTRLAKAQFLPKSGPGIWRKAGQRMARYRQAGQLKISAKVVNTASSSIISEPVMH